MDGSAMSAMEPRSIRSTGAAPRRLGDAGQAKPVELFSAEPAPVTMAAPAAAFEEAELFEAAPIAAALEDDHGWSFDEPVEAAPVAEPMIAAIQPDLIEADMFEPQAAAPAVTMEAEAAHEGEPLFPEMRDDRRSQQKGGWLSLFGGGRPRYEAAPPSAPAPVARETAEARPAAAAPVVQARSVGSAQMAEEPRSDAGEDLNIPAFLRRLAN
jgi:cell division protein FtsZ